MATIKSLVTALAEANLQIATLRVELAEVTKRSADNAHWANIYRQQRDAARKASNSNNTNSDYAARKAAAIAKAQISGKAEVA